MSSAVLVRIDRICAAVNDGFADFTSAAIAAACGPAAEVPKNGLGNPPTPVTPTPSAAATPGFCRTWPPVADTVVGCLLDRHWAAVRDVGRGRGDGASRRVESKQIVVVR